MGNVMRGYSLSLGTRKRSEHFEIHRFCGVVKSIHEWLGNLLGPCPLTTFGKIQSSEKFIEFFSTPSLRKLGDRSELGRLGRLGRGGVKKKPVNFFPKKTKIWISLDDVSF